MEFPDFPKEDEFTDCAGKTRRFQYTLDETPVGYILRAAEKDKEYGYTFQAFAHDNPTSTLGPMRKKIRAEINKRYFSENESRRFYDLNFDSFSGVITYDRSLEEVCLIVDGKKMSMEELKEVLSVYEGWEIEVKITEGY